jgi:hypothetical protein
MVYARHYNPRMEEERIAVVARWKLYTSPTISTLTAIDLATGAGEEHNVVCGFPSVPVDRVFR